jgi:hypothetical protein
MNTALLFVLMLLATSGATTTLWAQSVCRPADSLGALFKQEITRYSAPSTADELAVRDSLRLASANPTQVVLATQEAVCKKANAAYKAKLTDTGGSGFSNRVYVLQVGNTYAVFDPAFTYDSSLGYWTIVILDSRYKPLSVF